MSYFPSVFNSNRRDIAILIGHERKGLEIPLGYHQVCHGEVMPGDRVYSARIRAFMAPDNQALFPEVPDYICLIRKEKPDV